MLYAARYSQKIFKVSSKVLEKGIYKIYGAPKTSTDGIVSCNGFDVSNWSCALWRLRGSSRGVTYVVICYSFQVNFPPTLYQRPCFQTLCAIVSDVISFRTAAHAMFVRINSLYFH